MICFILKMQKLKFHLNILALCFIKGVPCQSIVLTPTKAYAYINESLTLTCTYVGYTNVAGTKWNINNQYTPTTIRHQDNTCSGGGIFAYDNIYRVGCPSDTSFTVTILRVQPEDLNITYECLDRNRKSNTVKILLKVSVANVELSGPSSSFMKEHSRQTIKCKTSHSRPQPRVSWYLYESDNSVKHKITVNSSIQIHNSEDELVAVESTLQFYPNRSINNWMLNCEALTDGETSAIHSKRLALNVAYPPQKPVIIGFTDGEKYSLIESEFGSLSCSSNGGNPLANLTWNCYNIKPTSMTIEDKTVSSTVTWSGFRGQSSCLCISHHSWSGTTQNTTVMIDALYPPNKPTMTISNKTVSNVINVILSKNVQVKCESKSNPHSNYTWTGPADLSKTKQILDVTINNTIDKMFKCIATNRMVRQNGTHVDGHNESAVTIKVLYPPGNPYFKYEYSNGTKVSTQNMIDVIAGDSFLIHCNAAGNPLPTYKWGSNEGNGILKITSVSSDTNKTCHAKNIMEETVGESRTVSTSASFFIRVLHAPYIPTIKISNGTRQLNITAATIQLRETDNINMTCFSEGKPLPKYTWDSHNDQQIQGRIRQFTNISRKDAGNYTCYASNLMKRTFGDTEQGMSVSSLSLDIMYPSTVLSLDDISILEGSDLNVICRVQKGNPTEESVSWTRISDDKNWKNSQLIITNVSRVDDTKYTCTLRSTIIPTIGDETLAIRSKTIHLNVFFSSEIKHFTVVKDKSSGAYIVNQTDEVSLECRAEANPASDLSIYNTRDKRIATVKNRNLLLYSITNASYENAGKYKCEGRNNYTKDKPSVSELTMIVKCSPRPSLDSIFPNKIAAAQYTNKTLNFVAYEYLDEENKTEFMWFHKNVAIERNDEKIEVFTIGLNSSLSVRNITQIDFGEYSVKVSNTLGKYVHHFMLQAEDKPDVPINLTYDTGSITESSVTLVWTPGFDGGFPQTFILLYMYSQEKKWHSVQVQDTNEQAMNYTLTGLLSSKVYNITMFSMNKKGNSSFTQNLQITTKMNIKTSDSQSSDNVGIISGSISGVAVVMIVSILLAVFFLKRRNIRSSQRESPKTGVTAVSHVSSTYTDLDASRREINNYDDFNVTYEHLNASSREPNTYMELKNTNVHNTDTSDYVNIRI